MKVSDLNLDYVVTGTGFCGTGYIAGLLTETGCKCTHEAIFLCRGHLGIEPVYLDDPIDKRAPARGHDWRSEVRGESAWPIACQLHLVPHILRAGGTFVHLVRHPLRWLWSWCTHFGEYDEASNTFASNSIVYEAAWRWLAVNYMILDFTSFAQLPALRYVRLPIETPLENKLARLYGARAQDKAYDVAKLNQHRNRHAKLAYDEDKVVAWLTLPRYGLAAMVPSLRALAARFGYEVPAALK